MKKFLSFFAAVVCTLLMTAQTNVSGGIYTNTTWFKANSPYIVTDTVVVFPGVTLTIQAGVTVKFASNKRLEIRHKLFALGTSADSITFTSNSVSPTPGIWSSIYLNTGSATDTLIFNYCNFRYGGTAISASNSADYLQIKRSSFANNTYGITGAALIMDSTNFMSNFYALVSSGGDLRYCSFKNNYCGLYSSGGNVDYCVISNNHVGWEQCGGSFISNCVIDSNVTGIDEFRWSTIINSSISHNQIGISDALEGDNIITYCNIDSNSLKGLYITGSTRDSVYRCKIRYNAIGLDITEDDASIYCNTISNDSIGIRLNQNAGNYMYNLICNNTKYGLQYTNSINTNIMVSNYWCTPDSASTEPLIDDGYDNINYGLVSFLPFDSTCNQTMNISQNSFLDHLSVYPNPTQGNVTVACNNNIQGLKILNMLGEIVYEINANSKKEEFELEKTGIYLMSIKTKKGTITKKLIVTN